MSDELEATVTLPSILREEIGQPFKKPVIEVIRGMAAAGWWPAGISNGLGTFSILFVRESIAALQPGECARRAVYFITSRGVV